MDLGLLYSAGKDSTLAGVLLAEVYDITAVTVHCGITDDWTHAREAARSLGWAFERVELDQRHAEAAVATMVEDGYPRHGIQQFHEQALEAVADRDFSAVADGTRRDDRVPALTTAQAQSLEDRHNLPYVTPLAGFGRQAVDQLVSANLQVSVGPSEEIPRADYEAELRHLMAQRHGSETVEAVFPEHEQTRVTGWADTERTTE
jgi:hypothetical protein